MSEIEKSLSFYDRNYVLRSWNILPGNRNIIIGNLKDRKCRFCDKSFPEVSFRQKAHAVLECLGNRTLFTAYECDNCNQFFGAGIENDFGNWSKPIRTFCRIKGKKGIPILKDSASGGWRIEHLAGGLHVTGDKDTELLEADEKAKTIKIRLKRDTYVPMAVLKTFFKIALSLIADEDVAYFRRGLDWICNPTHEDPFFVDCPIFIQTIPGPPAVSGLFIMILKRKSDFSILPYTMLLVSFGVQTYQVLIPSYEKDFAVIGREIKFPIFPTYSGDAEGMYGPPQISRCSLMDSRSVTNETMIISGTYDETRLL